MRKPILALLLVASLSACAINNVSTDYDPAARFDGIGRYAWAPAKADAPYPSLDQQRMRSAVDQALMQQAMRDVTPGEAQLWVQAGIDLKEQREVATVGMGTGYWDPVLIGGQTSVYVDQYTEATIYVQFISPADARVVWRGEVKQRWDERLSPAIREQRLQKTVQQILSRFPPSGK